MKKYEKNNVQKKKYQHYLEESHQKLMSRILNQIKYINDTCEKNEYKKRAKNMRKKMKIGQK